MNSRGTTSGVVDLVRRGDHYETKRTKLPDFVTSALKAVYIRGALRKGCPDLVIWRDGTARLRLVEVKCPEWDHPGPDQTKFMTVAKSTGIRSKVVEWRFVPERRLT
jgi:VRR-NUC domain